MRLSKKVQKYGTGKESIHFLRGEKKRTVKNVENVDAKKEN